MTGGAASGGAISGGPIDFLRLLAGRGDLVEALKTREKAEVLAAAADLGFAFTESAFDSAVWDAEVRLATWREEAFDARFALWQTMWGRYYLEYLVTDLFTSLEETSLTT